MTHTPGPWGVQEGATVWAMDGDYPNRPIFQPDRQYRRWGREISDKEMVLNASLAAAAPELLEALECLIHAVLSESGFAQAVRDDSGLAYPWAPMDIAEEKARAAIAKAKVE